MNYHQFESEALGEQPFMLETEGEDESPWSRRRRRSMRFGRRRRRRGFRGFPFPMPPFQDDDSDDDQEGESEWRGRIPPRGFASGNRAGAFAPRRNVGAFRGTGFRSPFLRRPLGRTFRSQLPFRGGTRPGLWAGRYPYRGGVRPGLWAGRYPYRSGIRPGLWAGRYPYQSGFRPGTWSGRFPFRQGFWPGRYPFQSATPYPWPGFLPPPFPMGPPDQGPDPGSFAAPPPAVIEAPVAPVFDPNLMPSPPAAPGGADSNAGGPGGAAPATPGGPSDAPDNPSEVYFEYGPEARGPSGMMSFTPTPVENPGGGRITNKQPPNRSELVHVRGVGRNQIPLHRLAAAALEALISAARAEGVPEPLLRPVSGFRDPARQAQLWQQALARYGSPQEARKWVAPPGGSAHQSGRAIDFHLGGHNASTQVGQLRTLPAYHWLVRNAGRFGFYPYECEPWHWEYNPPAGGRW